MPVYLPRSTDVGPDFVPDLGTAFEPISKKKIDENRRKPVSARIDDGSNSVHKNT